MIQQYWQSHTSGETWVVKLDRPDGEVKGMAGPLHHADMPRVAADYDGDFEEQSESCDYFQQHWDDFRKTSLSPAE
jgi:hypothetical protein